MSEQAPEETGVEVSPGVVEINAPETTIVQANPDDPDAVVTEDPGSAPDDVEQSDDGVTEGDESSDDSGESA